jgi:hypothetical protein
MSSESLLFKLLDFDPFGLLTFFFIPFISYKNIFEPSAPPLYHAPADHRPSLLPYSMLSHHVDDSIPH